MTVQATRSAPTNQAGIDRLLRWGLVATLLVVIGVLIWR